MVAAGTPSGGGDNGGGGTPGGGGGGGGGGGARRWRRFWMREAVDLLTGEAGLSGLTGGCEHCIVAQMLFRVDEVIAGRSGENNMAQGPLCCGLCAIVCQYLIEPQPSGESGRCSRDDNISCDPA